MNRPSLEEIAAQAQEPESVSDEVNTIIERPSDEIEVLENLYIMQLTGPTHHATRTLMTGPSLEAFLTKEDKDDPLSSFGATD